MVPLLRNARLRMTRLLGRSQNCHPADNRHAAYSSPLPHIIIGGCGRSGTTLVRLILDSHSGICCGPESKLFLPDHSNITELARTFKLDHSAVNSAYATSTCRAHFIDQFSEICRTATGKRRWAEKTPRNILNLDFIFSAWPQCRFIHVLRDGRDVACSLRTHPRHRVMDGTFVPLNTWNPIEDCINRWRNDIEASRRYWSDPRLHVVRYEDLVLQPQRTIENVIHFLGEDWDDALLDHSSIQSDFRDPLMFPQSAQATQKIATDSIGRWQRDLSSHDRTCFKALAGDLLIELGYAIDNEW